LGATTLGWGKRQNAIRLEVPVGGRMRVALRSYVREWTGYSWMEPTQLIAGLIRTPIVPPGPPTDVRLDLIARSSSSK
jgi:hypothetical protein